MESMLMKGKSASKQSYSNYAIENQYVEIFFLP